MIVIDKEPLDLTSKRGKEIEKQIKDLKSEGRVVTYKDPRPRRWTVKKAREKKPGQTFTLKKKLQNESGILEEWILCDHADLMADGKYRYEPIRFRVRESESINSSKEPELLWFLLNKMKKFKGLVIEDKKRDARDTNVKLAIESRVINIITDPKSLLTEENFRLLAGGWGVAKADSEDINIVRQVLLAKVKKGEANKVATGEGRGHIEFIHDSEEIGEEVKIRACVAKAIESKVVENVKLEAVWKYPNSDYVICRYPMSKASIADEHLIKEMLVDEKKWNILQNELEGQFKTPPGASVKDLELSDLTKEGLRKEVEKITNGELVLDVGDTRKVMIDKYAEYMADN